MRTHNGMRPQDVAILLKILSLNGQDWQYRDLAHSLSISISEISDSLKRSHTAGLVDESKKNIFRQSLMEFIEFGLPYVFPQIPGTMVTGYPTGHSHPYFKEKFISDENFVWPYMEGNVRGLAIEPLYKGAVEACQKDPVLHLMLASIDMIRLGSTRERKLALTELKKMILPKR
jgi:hypothetical protein